MDIKGSFVLDDVHGQRAHHPLSSIELFRGRNGPLLIIGSGHHARCASTAVTSTDRIPIARFSVHPQMVLFNELLSDRERSEAMARYVKDRLDHSGEFGLSWLDRL